MAILFWNIVLSLKNQQMQVLNIKKICLVRKTYCIANAFNWRVFSPQFIVFLSKTISIPVFCIQSLGFSLYKLGFVKIELFKYTFSSN